MVRMKRHRKRILALMTAACVVCAAVILLLVIFAFSVFKTRENGGSASKDPVMPEQSGGEVTAGPEEPEIQEGTEAGGEEEEPEEIPDPNAPKIDDDSVQDINSVVDTEMESDEGDTKRVYLTFDDGPSVYTEEILNILNEYGVKATFFVCGTGDSDESLRPVYKKIVDNGNTIGMHSYSHVYSKVYGNLDLFQYDLDKIRNLIYNETGVVPKYYRFPGGSGNTIASLPMDQYISVLYSQGMEYYDWNVYCGDSSGTRLSPSAIIKNTLEGVDKRRTAVVLLHDTGSRKNTVEALPGILKGLKERGLDIRPIDDETPPLHQVDEAMDNN